MTARNKEAYCGLYCGACPVYLNRTDSWIVKVVMEQYGIAIEDLHCKGCRSGTLSPSCRDCPARDCAKSKGLDSCSACPELPCEQIAGFSPERPHGKERVSSLRFLRDHGSQAWLDQQATQWTCTHCGRVGSWYEQTCADCGATLPAGWARPVS
jgi:hypothetical protein